jgi:hypothetical protein
VTRRTRRRLAVGIVFLLLVCAAGPYTGRLRGYHLCHLCRSARYETRWYVGRDPNRGLPLGTSQAPVEETQIYRDLYDPSHQHEWVALVDVTYDWFGLRTSGIGESWDWWSLIGGSYENDAGFRAFTRQEIADGNLTAERLKELLALPSGSIALAKLGERGQQLDSERKSLLAQYALAK